jgi:glycosyltransferase involved in cell wall biosynthesis
MADIAAVVIVYNEAEVMERCLASLKWVDELIVVDDESTDGSADMARAHGAQVFARRLDRFDAQRNFGADQSRCAWILAVDADEAVPAALAEEIRATIDRPDAADVYGIPFCQKLFGRWPRHGSWGDPLYRLYRREVRWSGAVHERVGAEGNWRRAVLHSPILHWSHQSVAQFIAKLNRYTDEEAAARAAEGFVYSPWKLVLSPVRDFWRRFVVQGGYRDGAVGLVLAGLMACYLFIVRAKTWELTHPADEPPPFEVAPR